MNPLLRRSGVALLIATLCPLANAGAPVPATGQSAQTTLRINLRSAPDLQSRIITVVPREGTVSILEVDGEFVRVRRPGGEEGYLKFKYLTGYTPAEAVVERTAQLAEATPPVSTVESAGETPPLTSRAEMPPSEDTNVIPPSAGQAVEPDPSPDLSPWSISVGVGGYSAELSVAEITNGLRADGFNAQLTDTDTAAPYGHLRIGYRLNQLFGVDVGVMHFEDLDFQLQSTAASAQQGALAASLAQQMPVTSMGITLAASLNHEMGPVELSGRLGMWRSLDSDLVLQLGGQTSRVQTSEATLLMGFGLGYRLNPQWSIGVEMQALDPNNSLATLGALVTYRP